ncbi:MAG: ornithine carbamoyltransferase [Gammaproteobacteria bacterium]|nr:ornithine carbamoyltransferase [Gammaproteobacteria bacterium]MDD9875418.1 ornithine carbamoyltransferase [Gammaproteobacteria bacterium]
MTRPLRPLRHFLSLMDLSTDELRRLIARAVEIKSAPGAGPADTGDLLRNQTAALVFEKSSTRTRVSFETGVAQLGGHAIFIAPADSHLARGEAIEDTARVLSRMARLIIMRTGPHERVERMAESASVPVINALSDFNHPCQQLADIQTYFEHRGDLSGRRVAWVGDGNNVCHSWMNAARQLDFHLAIATPAGYAPNRGLARQCAAHIVLGNDPAAAVAGADLVVTDSWISMGQEREKAARGVAFKGFCVDREMMSRAAADALFMHCLPAYRGHEVSAEVIDGGQSVVWDQAENRLHAQKALMEFLLR